MMTKYLAGRWLILVLALLLAGCAAATPAAPGVYEPMAGTDFEGVIVSAEHAPEFGLTGEFWTPSEFDVLQLENWLEKYLADNRREDLALKLEEYRRQYVGVVVDGSRLVRAFFFCDAGEVDWKSAPVATAAAGECYFTVEFNAETGLFTRVEINP